MCSWKTTLNTPILSSDLILLPWFSRASQHWILIVVVGAWTFRLGQDSTCLVLSLDPLATSQIQALESVKEFLVDFYNFNNEDKITDKFIETREVRVANQMPMDGMSESKVDLSGLFTIWFADIALKAPTRGGEAARWLLLDEPCDQETADERWGRGFVLKEGIIWLLRRIAFYVKTEKSYGKHEVTLNAAIALHSGDSSSEDAHTGINTIGESPSGDYASPRGQNNSYQPLVYTESFHQYIPPTVLNHSGTADRAQNGQSTLDPIESPQEKSHFQWQEYTPQYNNQGPRGRNRRGRRGSRDPAMAR
ncbi:hypothetical protein ABW19_dt0204870 [Dactylella cylindrospora]|nr:hypothetical protein ABW19_dt0204870 [Dactylella cylindrospora]